MGEKKTRRAAIGAERLQKRGQRSALRPPLERTSFAQAARRRSWMVQRLSALIGGQPAWRAYRRNRQRERPSTPLRRARRRRPTVSSREVRGRCLGSRIEGSSEPFPKTGVERQRF